MDKIIKVRMWKLVLAAICMMGAGGFAQRRGFWLLGFILAVAAYFLVFHRGIGYDADQLEE